MKLVWWILSKLWTRPERRFNIWSRNFHIWVNPKWNKKSSMVPKLMIIQSTSVMMHC
jgi:hypothetical protein